MFQNFLSKLLQFFNVFAIQNNIFLLVNIFHFSATDCVRLYFIKDTFTIFFTKMRQNEM